MVILQKCNDREGQKPLFTLAPICYEKKANILLEALWPLDIKEKLWKTTQNNVIDIESSGLGFKWLLDQMYYFC